MTICGEAENGRSAVSLAQRLDPHLVILDVSMPGLNGIDAARQIRQACPSIHILMLTMHESDELLSEVLALGVRGFVLKSDASTELVAAIKAVSEEKFFISSGIAGTLISGYLTDTEEQPPLPVKKDRLTAREREIVQLLAEGRSNKEVAGALNIAVKTVETHRTNILKKIGAHSIAEVVRYAIRNKIVQP